MKITYNEKGKPIRWIMSVAEFKMHEEEYSGLCANCGEVRWGETEPDARRYPCEECGKKSVYGVPEMLIIGAIEINDDTEE